MPVKRFILLYASRNTFLIQTYTCQY